jgi:basic amino acid/polyamine antiporter, APA family
MMNGNGFAFMIIIAITVGIAILGTTLAAMNTGVRISFAMAQDGEMPDLMGFLHDEWATPYVGVVVMVIVSALVATVGLFGGVVTLTGITLASNLGTFVLYGLICLVTVVAFVGTGGFSFLKHAIIPALGVIGNVVMVLTIFVVGILTGGDTAKATFLALGISAGWLVLSVLYFVVTSRSQGKAIIPATPTMESGQRTMELEK